MSEISILTQAFSKDGILAVLVALLIVGGMREWYVWGPTFRRERVEKEFYRGIALRAVSLTREAVDVAK